MKSKVLVLALVLACTAAAQAQTELDTSPASLEQAGAAAPDDAATLRQLSAAYAESGRADLALGAVQRAMQLEPDVPDDLRRQATLATWLGRYQLARLSYLRLRQLTPTGPEIGLDLARVTAWGGDTDAAVGAYREYLRAHPDHAEAWLELALAESWRGNVAAARAALNAYGARFGPTPDHDRVLAGVLARGGRPREAEQLTTRLLRGDPNNYDLALSRTIALAGQHKRRDALDSLASVRRLEPDRPETRSVRRLLQSAVASTAEPRGIMYGDSDGLRVQRLSPRLNLSLLNGTRIEAGYERADLRARRGSGLEHADGGLEARHQFAWLGFSQQFGGLTLSGTAGPAWLDDDEMIAYRAGLQIAPVDALRLSVSRESGYFVVSPRTLSLEMTRLAHRVGLDWAPGELYHLSLDATYEELSDGNRRWDVLMTPRRTFARTQRLNLDLGVQARRFGADRQLTHGYYDPQRYEHYAVVAFPYFKISESTGLALSVSAGAQRDDSTSRFRPGGHATADATFGIYRAWMLKVSAGATYNERLESGAFRGYSGGIALVRRF